MLAKEVKKGCEGLSILYVEDEGVTREQVVQILRMFFRRVAVAGNGRMGIEAYRAEPADLVITDITMPCMDGIEMLGYLVEQKPGLAFVIMSAHNDALRLLEKANLHPCAIIKKPIDIDTTLRALYEVCSRRLDGTKECT